MKVWKATPQQIAARRRRQESGPKISVVLGRSDARYARLIAKYTPFAMRDTMRHVGPDGARVLDFGGGRTLSLRPREISRSFQGDRNLQGVRTIEAKVMSGGKEEVFMLDLYGLPKLDYFTGNPAIPNELGITFPRRGGHEFSGPIEEICHALGVKPDAIVPGTNGPLWLNVVKYVERTLEFPRYLKESRHRK